MTAPIRLTQYSHGAGCGCKLSPKVLDRILQANEASAVHNLLVGNDARDDAAAMLLDDGSTVALSTTDFFMPIVDDPYTFGRIASANATSDIYAMGGRPLMALSILGWPIDKIAPEVAGDVVRGARDLCREAGMPLAGGHSIDSPEPIFGLAVTGVVDKAHLKRNHTAQVGDVLLLTKGIGVGILTTAEKRGILRDDDEGRAARSMCQLNSVGKDLATIAGVHALTDVTGFGLLGHLVEMTRGSGTKAEVVVDKVPLLTDLDGYLEQGCTPGGTGRNYDSYGAHVAPIDERTRSLLCDPQTSGGLLLSVARDALDDVKHTLDAAGLEAFTTPIGEMVPQQGEHLVEAT